MKHGHALAIGTLALALAACGGNSHHDTTTTPTTDPTTTTPGATPEFRVEAKINPVTVSAGPGSGSTTFDPDPGYRFQDTLNIQLRDSITFQLVYYTGSGANLVRNVVGAVAGGGTDNSVTFTTSDLRGAAGSLTPTDGSFAASSNAVGPYRVTANYAGSTYTTSYLINPRQIRTHGAVVEDTGRQDADGNPIYQGVYNAQVDFYEVRNSQSSRQTIVQSVHTGEDGTFRASVPVPVAGDVRFVVRPPNGSGFVTTYTFQGADYTPESNPTSDQVANEFPSLASILAPTGGYATGDFYLVPGGDILPATGSTFSIRNSDPNVVVDDEANLIVVSRGTASSSLKTKSSSKKAH